MNKKQLFATANEDEQRWLIILTAQVIEERKQRIIFSRGRLVREKRGNFPGAHFLNDRRSSSSKWFLFGGGARKGGGGRRSPQRTINRVSFVFILTVMSVATWLFTMHAPSELAAAALIIHTVLLWMILIKPYTFRLQTT